MNNETFYHEDEIVSMTRIENAMVYFIYCTGIRADDDLEYAIPVSSWQTHQDGAVIKQIVDKVFATRGYDNG